MNKKISILKIQKKRWRVFSEKSHFLQKTTFHTA